MEKKVLQNVNESETWFNGRHTRSPRVRSKTRQNFAKWVSDSCDLNLSCRFFLVVMQMPTDRSVDVDYISKVALMLAVHFRLTRNSFTFNRHFDPITHLMRLNFLFLLRHHQWDSMIKRSHNLLAIYCFNEWGINSVRHWPSFDFIFLQRVNKSVFFTGLLLCGGEIYEYDSFAILSFYFKMKEKAFFCCLWRK